MQANSCQETPCIVVAKENNALQIYALNDAAAGLGLEPGLPLANARAICPDIAVVDADAAADSEALNHIADWCDRFTPLVALDLPHGLLLDITGCAHLFGGEALLLQTLCGALQRQGFVVTAAIAGTPVCARALARCRPGRIVGEGEEAEAVTPLPVFALGASEAITRGLRRAGLKTIGDVAARARAEITARFGAWFTGLLEQALGQAEAPINPRKPLPEYIVEKRFAEPVATDEVISATLAGLARTLVVAMERQGKGARRLEASFFRTDGAVRAIAVETGAARHPTPMSSAGCSASGSRPSPIRSIPASGSISSGSVPRPHRNRGPAAARSRCQRSRQDELADLIDRIAARIGGSRVMVHLPQGSHIPERAALALPAQHHLGQAAHADWPARTEHEPPLRPLRLFERPEQIQVIAQVPDGPPARFVWRRAAHAVVRAEGPERIAMEWWRAQGDMLTRDYFRVEDESGLRFWLYRDGLYDREIAQEEGRAVQPNWFMHGLFA